MITWVPVDASDDEDIPSEFDDIDFENEVDDDEEEWTPYWAWEVSPPSLLPPSLPLPAAFSPSTSFIHALLLFFPFFSCSLNM